MYLNTFISLEENVGGYGKNQRKPNGHVTITSPGIVKCYIQDLKEGEKPYALYLLSKNKNKAVRLGLLNKIGATKQTVWKMEMENIHGTPLHAKDIDCAIVVKEGNGIANTDTILAGYTTGRYLTTSMLERELPKVAPKVKVIETDTVLEKIKSMKVLEVVKEPVQVATAQEAESVQPACKDEVSEVAKVDEVTEAVEIDEVAEATEAVEVAQVSEVVKVTKTPEVTEVIDCSKGCMHMDDSAANQKDEEPVETECAYAEDSVEDKVTDKVEVQEKQEENEMDVPEKYKDMLNCGFQVKDGQVKEAVIEQIKDILNDKEKSTCEKDVRHEEAMEQLDAFIEASEQEDLSFTEQPVEVFLTRDDSDTLKEACTREDKDAAYLQEMEEVLYGMKDAIHPEK